MPRYDDYSREELVRLLEARDRRDATRFGLVWETNEVEREKALNGDFVALDLDAALSTAATPGAEGADAEWRNLIIEGDNFDALRFLRMAYAGRVKCICIDPPYNTGNRDFVYNDRYVDKDDAWRHSRWCEFMHQRLTLAKELLAEDGVIFVHIDDIEVHHLGLLMAQIFGEQNFLGTIIWHNVTDNNPTRISVEHEYILAFARNETGLEKVWKTSAIPIKEKLLKMAEDLKMDYPNVALRQSSYSEWFRKNKTFMWPFDRYKFIDDGGIYTGSQSVHNPGKEGYRYDVIHPETGQPCKEPMMGYRFAPETMKKLLEDGRILFGEDETKIIELKLYVQDYKAKLPSVIEMDTRLGANELRQMFPQEKRLFSFPKPSDLVQELISFATSPDDIVLDFFAGSGTTGHAVLKANAGDGGKRRFILVSSTEATEEEPEKNLCRDVCAERVRRVIVGYGEKAGLGGDFAYLRCRRIPEGDLMEIEHSQVWTALQLMHREGLTAYAPAALHWAQDAEGALCYVPQVKAGTAREILKRAKGVPGVVVYTWQPGLMADRLAGSGHIQVETIPQSLALKFGLGRGRA